MFSYLNRIWNQYGFELTFILCVLVILVGSLFQKKGKGTWSKYYFNPFDTRITPEIYQPTAPKKIAQGKRYAASI